LISLFKKVLKEKKNQAVWGCETEEKLQRLDKGESGVPKCKTGLGELTDL
jgi:hypothetical protein